MSVLGIDPGGTKLTSSVFTGDGIVLSNENVPIGTLKEQKQIEVGIISKEQGHIDYLSNGVKPIWP